MDALLLSGPVPYTANREAILTNTVIAPLTHWRDARAHGVVEHRIDVCLDATVSALASAEAVVQRAGRVARRTEDAGSGGRRQQPARDPELVARVRSLMGKLAHTAKGGMESEALHRERQADKQKEERFIEGHG